MKKYINFFIRVISLISIIFEILILLYVNFGHNEDHEYHYKQYNNCLNNITNEEESSYYGEKENCEKYYIKNAIFFILYLCIYIYITFNVIVKISFLINSYVISCQVILFVSNILTYVYFGYLFLSVREQMKISNKIFIIAIIIFIIDIILLFLKCSIVKDNKEKYNGPDCLDLCVEINNKEIKERICKEITIINEENNLLKEENQKLLELKRSGISNNIEDKKIEVILWYVENNYHKKFSPNISYEYLLEEIKSKFGKDFDKNKLEKIYLDYIKQKFFEILTCPCTGDIFINPKIVPEGQTFDYYYLSKEVKSKRKNPLTGKILYENQLIDNILVKDLCIILNQEPWSMHNFLEMRKLLINPENKKFYSNPVVIKEGDKKGETEEGIGFIAEYSNKVVLNIIEENKEILNDRFFEDIKENNSNNLNNINNLNIIEETINTDIRLNINIK